MRLGKIYSTHCELGKTSLPIKCEHNIFQYLKRSTVFGNRGEPAQETAKVFCKFSLSFLSADKYVM